jgi:hypothetical protein
MDEQTSLNGIFVELRDLNGFGAAIQGFYAASQNAGLGVSDFEGPKFTWMDRIQKLLPSIRLDENLQWKTPVVA